MRIYSMTATFGSLEHRTLTLEPGLNVIHAPNEWGKSTWCAFLINMLYGVETRARSSSAGLADKDRYAPWSGAPMSGRIELNWNGRDITIERTSNARTPMGIFKAYETESGLDIPELNGSNCGQLLLGVERSVFTKAGFLRLADLPVVQDDALRRRLNNLVTTGDESGTADKLGQTLKNLKNKCYSNKANGLLPEAEEQRAALRQQLSNMQDLQQNLAQSQTRLQELETQLAELENHQAALHYERSLEDARQVTEAEQAAQTAQTRLEQLTQQSQQVPSPQQAQAALDTANALQEEQMALLSAQQALPPAPQTPTVPAHFAGMTPQEAVQAAQADQQAYEALEARRAKNSKLIPIFSIGITFIALMMFIGHFAFKMTSPILLIAGCVLLTAGIIATVAISTTRSKRYYAEQEALFARHPGQSPDTWIPNAQAFAAEQAAYEAAMDAYRSQTAAFQARKEDLEQRIRSFAGAEPLSQCRTHAQQAIRLHTDLADAKKEAEQTGRHAEALRSMAKVAEPPQKPDTLRYSAQQTEQLLSSARFEQRQLQLKLAQYQAQEQAQGQEPVLRARLEQLNKRIAHLEEYYAAIELAQSALSKASAALQRRFAPRISKRAQELFSRLTDGRYQKIAMAEDMSLSTAAQNEDTLREAQRRSDGTVDQLYLALRLAVAEELTPSAPLVLDDALVRFDDQRLKRALELLQEEAETKQVILFTCQQREKLTIDNG